MLQFKQIYHKKIMQDLYTNLDEAKIQIQKRWNNDVLKNRVQEYLKKDLPEKFLNGPYAVLFRNIASPDLEFMYFLKIAKEHNLKPLVLEYTKDKFSTRNADKICLTKLAIFEKRDKNGNAIVQYKKIVDMKGSDNKRFDEIETVDGRNLVQLHHELVQKMALHQIDIIDISDWISRNGGSAKEYYMSFFAFFIAHGVLFENFVTDESEAQFERDVVLPAFDAVQSFFGLRPLIVSLADDPNDPYWWSYPAEINNYIK